MTDSGNPKEAGSSQRSDAEFELFAHALAHDLRAPLRAIGGFSEVLLESRPGELEPLARQYLPRIAAASTRMAQLLDDLLEWVRIGNAAYAPQQVDASDVAARVIDTLREKEPERSVRVDIAPGCLVRADGPLLRAAFQRTLSNAWKFTSQADSARIEIGMRSEGGEDILWVRDNGAGFDPQQGHRLFQPLQRLHRVDQFAGSGVGLAIVRRIAERHGGRVWGESAAEGAGATFYFALPR
jgi:light-regulated signal transduction histidine kinase (bacteriophytochrome)